MTVQQIFITGASAGIGAALAELYAARHGAELALGLVARRADRLQALSERLGSHGARVLTYAADVRDREAMLGATRDFVGAAGGVTLAIANAGISPNDRLPQGDPGPGADTVITNLAGVIHTLQPLIPTLMAQRQGHLVCIGSVAGFFPLPGKGAYCASKAAVKLLMDSWRTVLRPHGIRCSTICPGWVASEMTASNQYAMPFQMDVARAALLIAWAIERRRATYVFPWQMRLAVTLGRALPHRLLPTFAMKS